MTKKQQTVQELMILALSKRGFNYPSHLSSFKIKGGKLCRGQSEGRDSGGPQMSLLCTMRSCQSGLLNWIRTECLIKRQPFKV